MSFAIDGSVRIGKLQRAIRLGGHGVTEIEQERRRGRKAIAILKIVEELILPGDFKFEQIEVESACGSAMRRNKNRYTYQ